MDGKVLGLAAAGWAALAAGNLRAAADEGGGQFVEERVQEVVAQ